MLVLKFGGTSVGSAKRIEEVASIVLDAHKKDKQIVVAASAMSGITNALIEIAQTAEQGNMKGALSKLEAVKAKHMDCAKELFQNKEQLKKVEDALSVYLNELDVLVKGISYLKELTSRSLDAVSGIGELLSSTLLAEALSNHLSKDETCLWLDARQFIITDETFGRAVPKWDELKTRTNSAIKPALQRGSIVITQGFIGSTPNGVKTTLGRGGSDYTAAILGVALGADEIQIWTDVDGMMTADPRLVPSAKPIAEVTFQEAAELAYFGAKVLHPLTIKPAVEANIPVRILNTMRPKEPGTIIKSTSNSKERICAVATKKGLTALLVSSPRMLMAHGFLARIFAVFDRHNTSIDLIATSEVSVALTVDRTEELKPILNELGEHGEVQVLSDVAIVTIVGRQFREHSGIASDVFQALKNVNILMISGGASDINLSLVVSQNDADKSIKLLHDQFFAGNLMSASAHRPA